MKMRIIIFPQWIYVKPIFSINFIQNVCVFWHVIAYLAYGESNGKSVV